MSRLTLNTLRYSQLLVGLFFCGTALALMLWASVGLAPWDVLSQGIMKLTGLSFGTITVILSLVVMLLWIPLRQKPGIGTIANALLIGAFADLWLTFLPEQNMDEVARYVVMLFGIFCMGFGSGLYIGAGLGPGPRDGLMTGIHHKFGWTIWKVRTGLELSVLALGWIMGGQVGVGTIVFSILIGPLCQIFIPLFSFKVYTQKSKELPTSEIPVVG